MPADTPYQEQLAIWEIANAPGISADSILTRTDLIKLWIRRYRLPRFIVLTMQSEGDPGRGLR